MLNLDLSVYKNVYLFYYTHIKQKNKEKLNKNKEK